MNLTKSAARVGRLASVVTASCLVLASCSSDPELDIAAVEEKLVSEQEATSPDLEVGEASCPNEVTPEEGATFECTVDVEGVDAPYTVTVTGLEDGDDSAHFEFEPSRPIIDVSKVVEFIRSQLNEGVGDVEVACGDEAVIVTDVGSTIDCSVSDGTTTEDVQILVKDLQGTVEFAQ